MNNYLIRSLQILFPGSPHHGQVADVLVESGIVRDIGRHIAAADPKNKIQVINGQGQYLVPGFFDMNVNFGEPGLETKEDIESGAASAFASGFTAVAVQPNTQPPLHRHAEVALVKKRAEGLPVEIYPLGTVTKHREGKELAELYDMQLAGAVAFTDGDRSLDDAGVMGRALQYSHGIGALVMAFAEDRQIAAGAMMNEGPVSTYLGMKGKPNLAESLMVARDLYLAEYYNSRIHFSTVSTAESVDLIRRAKKNGLQVSCDVAAHHLVLTDEAVKGFDSQYKVNPPLRTKQDIKALLKGLKDGTIDAVVSQHTPQEVEHKRVEFQVAKDGITGLQTVLPMLLKAGLTPEVIVDKLALAPRKILGLPMPVFDKDRQASFTIFDPGKEWVFDAGSNRSKSTNSPFFGATLTGAVTFVINKNQTYNPTSHG